MNHITHLYTVTIVAFALTALFDAGAASATSLEQYRTPSANVKLGLGTEIIATLEAGTSVQLTETNGWTFATCAESAVKGKIESGTPAAHPSGNLSLLSFTKCSTTRAVLANGSLEIQHIAGTTNGVVISKGARVTVKLPFFGTSCIANTGAGTPIGTLTGAKSSTGQATMDLNGVIPLENGCFEAILTGSYTVTSPTGVTVEGS